jgi:hypothetical protein
MCLIRLGVMLQNQFLAHFLNKKTVYDPFMYRFLLHEYFDEI